MAQESTWLSASSQQGQRRQDRMGRARAHDEMPRISEGSDSVGDPGRRCYALPTPAHTQMPPTSDERLDTDSPAQLGRRLGGVAATPICVTRGPAHRVEIMNAAFEVTAGIRGALGRPFGDVCAGALAQPQLRLMDRAYAEDERLVVTDVVVRSSSAPAAKTGAPGVPTVGERRFTFVYEPLHDGAGAVDGLVTWRASATARRSSSARGS